MAKNSSRWNPQGFADNVKANAGRAAGKAKDKVDKVLGRDKASKELADFKSKYDEAGSKEEERRVSRLYDSVVNCNYQFMSYPLDMEKFDGKSGASQAYRMNEEYLNRMMDMCVVPLSRGMGVNNVIDTIGIYVGMSLANPEFRKHCSAKVTAAMYPAVEKIGMCGAKLSDWKANGALALMTGVEKVTKKEFDITKKLRDRVPATEAMDARLKDIHDRVMRGKDGRVPLTPESAAVMYLGFVNQSYSKMREPGADCNEIKEQFDAAKKTLYNLAVQDGIPNEQLDKNVRIIAGQLIEKHPELATLFEETAYEDVKKAPPKEVEIAGGKKYKVWSGEYVDRRTGKPHEGPFTPRIPRRTVDIESAAESFMGSVYDQCDTVDAIGEVCKTSGYAKVKDHFMRMIYHDRNNAQFTGDEDKRSVEQVMRDVDMRCGEKWAETHQDAAADYVNRKDAEARQQRERRVEGLVPVGSEPSMGDDEYDG